MKTAIIGGAGGMGKLIAKEFKRYRDSVIISDKVDARDAASELGVRYGTNEEAIKNSDEIVLAVSLSAVDNVIDEYRELFTSDKTVYDIASVKYLQSKNVSIIDKLRSLEAKTFSSHPMLGPNSPGFKGYNVVLIPTNEESPIEEYRLFFKDTLGAKPVVLKDGETHDKYMAKVLALGHILGYISAASAEAGDIPFNDLLKFTGTTFLMNRAFTEFVLSSSIDTYGLIQLENQYAQENIRLIEESTAKFNDILSSGDYWAFESEIKRIQDYYKSQDEEYGLPMRKKFVQSVTASNWSSDEYEEAKKAVDKLRKAQSG